MAGINPCCWMKTPSWSPTTTSAANSAARCGIRQKFGDRRDAGHGDCVDCNHCVAVCPTGIDIRNGMQMECVQCTACMDACDNVMDKIGSPRGLIRYASLNGIERREPLRFTPRLAGYCVVMARAGRDSRRDAVHALRCRSHRLARARLAFPTDARRAFQQSLHGARRQQNFARNAGGIATGKSGRQSGGDGAGEHRRSRRKNFRKVPCSSNSNRRR